MYLTTEFLGTLKSCKMWNYVIFIRLPGLYLTPNVLFPSTSWTSNVIGARHLICYLPLVDSIICFICRFCVAWYPVYRVPRGNFRAAFLTYHSLGKLVPQKCSPDLTGWHTRIVSPVVGLQSYNDKVPFQNFLLRVASFCVTKDATTFLIVWQNFVSSDWLVSSNICPWLPIRSLLESMLCAFDHELALSWY